MNKLTIWYLIKNGGDGSAHPIFCSSKKLAEWLGEQEYEPFCDAVGSLDIYGDNISVEVVTPEEILIEKLCSKTFYKKEKDFIKIFFPDGISNMEVIIKDRDHYSVKVNGRHTINHFVSAKTSKDGRQWLEVWLNQQITTNTGQTC